VFAERSTLTIAHRLDTIIFSDKILAMAQGQVRARAGGGCTARAGRA
jgi:ABC-type transport system involved in Fe-S cluster assembly fused permease/ATPase subunit